MKDAARRILEAAGDSGGVTVMTGAGISAESGIRTFRDGGGLWEEQSIEEVATPEGFAANPALVHGFYNARRAQLGTVEPNEGHRALVRLERLFGERFSLITQNVDDLHERAGSGRVLHMHGELYKARCVDCAAVVEWREDISLDDACRACSGRMRPHIVWFGEIPFHLEKEIPAACNGCGVFFSIGTSGVVYPAAGLAGMVHSTGGLCAEINLETSPANPVFELQLEGPAGEVLPALLDELELQSGA
jgi:NAD-dependent deacetylase